MRQFLSGLNLGIPQDPETLSIWATGCWHSPKDVAKGFYPFAAAYNQIKDTVPYDLILALGDFDSKQAFPTGADADIQDVIDDINVLDNTGELYTIAGNHDAGDANMDWFKAAAWNHIDHNAAPYPKLGQKSGWEWERYYLKIGNVILIMLSDRNDLPYPIGRGGSVVQGGHPSGAVTQETFDWMTGIILANQDCNIITCHHNLPKETTVATGPNEGALYHGSSGIPEGRGALWSIYDESIPDSDDGTNQFHQFYLANPGAVLAHIGSHTHAKVDAVHYGRRIHEYEDGVHFFNIGSLTQSHAVQASHPYSTFFNLTQSSSDMVVKLYKHTNQDYPQGFYDNGEITIQLKYPYNPNHI